MMEERHKNIILGNLEKLSSEIRLRHLEDELISQHLLTVAVLNGVKNKHDDQRAQTKAVLERITTRGNEAFYKLIDCLLKTNHEKAALILNPDLKHFNNDGNYTDVNFTPIIVKKSSLLYTTPLYSVFQMDSYPRGGALIISNTKFDDRKLNREGGEVDEQNVASLFDQLGFKVFKHQNLTRDEMKKELVSFGQSDKQKTANAAVIVIMSHGEPDGILGIDNKPLPESEVFSILNAKNSPLLNGKPKMFFIQACRGKQKDESDSEPSTIQIEVPYRVPLFSHMKACFSTCEDMVAWRSPIYGSWFIRTLVEVFSAKAATTELDAMLKEVARKINDMETDSSAKQSVDIRGYGWDRDLYFNPGLYIEK